MSEAEQDRETVEDTEPQATVSDWPAPGQLLKKRREEMGLSHGRVADALHMTAHYVKALESDEYEKLPGRTFVKGYFRSYAKLLGLDADEIIDCYQQYNAALVETEENEANDIRAQKAYDQNLRWMICAAVIIILVVGASWWFSRDDDSAAAVADPVNRAVAGSPGDQIPVTANNNDTQITAEQLIATLADKPIENTSSTNAPREIPADTSEADKTDSDINDSAAAVTVSAGEPVLASNQRQALYSDSSNVLSAPDAMPVLEERITSENGPDTAEPQSPLPVSSEYTVTRIDDRRRVELESEGADMLEVHFSGDSWIEVDDGDNMRLYHDMLYTGDALSIKGKGPFNILIGDANMVDMVFNSRAVDLQSRIRSDNSARIILETQDR